RTIIYTWLNLILLLLSIFFIFFFFFFQAEDGIRDPLVTGVQTCALPISDLKLERPDARASNRASNPCSTGRALQQPRTRRGGGRSEERRVGKEWRTRWAAEQ